MIKIRKKIQKIVKEGKEYIIETSFSGDTVIVTKERELVPVEYVDIFENISENGGN